MAVQNDGKIVVVGTNDIYASNRSDFVVARFNPDGSLDPTFNGTGKVNTSFGGKDTATCVVIQDDGKLVVAGVSERGYPSDIALARYNADGSLDTTLNGTGMVKTSRGTGRNRAAGIALQGDGKIIVAGYTTSTDTGDAAMVIRYNSDGSLDTKFNGTGIVLTDFGGGEYANAVAVQSDGKIVAVGSTANMFVIVLRYNTDGTPDMSFNGTGARIFHINGNDSSGYGVAIQDDGKILIAGNAFSGGTWFDFAVVRLSPSGSYDLSFNEGRGVALTPVQSDWEYATDLVLQHDGKIVVGGYSGRLNPINFAVVRYLGDGTLDPTFGSGGIVITDLGTDETSASVALQADGKIVLAGTSGDSMAVVRYEGDPNTTASPQLLAPLANAVSIAPVNVEFVLPNDALSGSVKIRFIGAVSTYNMSLSNLVELAGHHQFSFDPANPAAAPEIATGDVIPNGIYTVMISYQDDTGGLGSGQATNVSLDAHTLPPTLTSPAPSSFSRSPVAVLFSLPEPALHGSVKLTFDDGTSSRELSLATLTETSGGHTFSFNPADPTASPEIITGETIPDGIYTATLSYQDEFGNVAAGATSTNVTIDTTILAPTLTAPASDILSTSPVAVEFTLPETALGGSVKLNFANGIFSRVLTLSPSVETPGSHSFFFNPSNPSVTPEILSGSAIPDGTYTATLSYQDTAGNDVASASSTNVTIDANTLTPTLNSPAPFSIFANPVGVSFSLPEAAMDASVKLTFDNGIAPRVLNLSSLVETPGSHSFTFNPADPGSTPEITNGDIIPDGIYTVTLSYQDAQGNAGAVDSSAAVRLDTQTFAPILTSPASSTTAANPIAVSFTLPEAPLAGSVKLNFNNGISSKLLTLSAIVESMGSHGFSFDPGNLNSALEIASGDTIPDGTYEVTLTYQDSLGNPVAGDSSTNVNVDGRTLTPTLTAPASATVTASPIAVSFILPEAAMSGSVRLNFDNETSVRVLTLASEQEGEGGHSFSFDPAAPSAAPEIANGEAIPDGTYTVSLAYRDMAGNAMASASTVAVVVDTQTLTPTLTDPKSNLISTNPITVSFTLPEAAKSGSVQLSFDDGTSARVLSLSSLHESEGAHDFLFDTSAPTASPDIAVGDAIPDGIYKVSIGYRDAAGNAMASAFTTDVTIDTTTLTPTLTSPAPSVTTSRPIPVSFSLPEAARADSVHLVFDDGTSARTLNLAAPSEAQGSHTFSFDPTTPTDSPEVVGGDAIPDGTYTVTLEYRDLLGNPAAAHASIGVTVDTRTLTPTLTAPASSTITTTPIAVSFSLPEIAASGSVKLTFSNGASTTVLSLSSALETSGIHSFAFNPAAPETAPEISSGDPILDGTYTVTLSYRDLIGNSEVSGLSSTGVTIDTTAPDTAITAGPADSSIRNFVTFEFTSGAPDATFEVQLDGDGFAPATSPVTYKNLLDGEHTFEVRACDALGNCDASPATQTWSIEALIDPLVSLPFATGGAVPGAGESPAIPAGARWLSFGTPSINDEGHVAFLGKWRAPGSTGQAIFAGPHEAPMLLAAQGDAPPILGGARFRSFRDPLFNEHGDVVFLAQLKGSSVTRASKTALIATSLKSVGSLVILARTGNTVPEADGATLKRILNVSLGEHAISPNQAPKMTGSGLNEISLPAATTYFTGLLKRSAGLGSVTKANDSGVWSIPAGTTAAHLLLREGDIINVAGRAEETVKTFGALQPGAYNLGQGRGAVGDINGDSSVAIRVTTRFGNQAIGTLNEFGDAKFAYATGIAVPGDPPNLTFGSFGVPTQNDTAALTFLATTMGGNEQALFMEDEVFNLNRIVTQGQVAPGAPEATFASFEDPIGAGNRQVSFMASLTGATRADDQGIWTANDSDITLIAREGMPAPDTNGGAFKTFISIAHPPGMPGPMFTAAVSSPDSTVSKANDRGLWSTGTDGNVRALLREGDIIDNRTVKSLVVLKSVAGSPAQSRVFNSSGEVVLRVTFTDRSQGIVKVTIP